MRLLLTGASGFVGPHVVANLRQIFGPLDMLPTAKDASVHPVVGTVEKLDIVDRAAVDAVIARYVPTCIIHLAGIAAPTAANADPRAAWRVHVEGTLNSCLFNFGACPALHILVRRIWHGLRRERGFRASA